MNASTPETGIQAPQTLTFRRVALFWGWLGGLLTACAGVTPPAAVPPLAIEPSTWNVGETRGIDLFARLTQLDTGQPEGREEPAARLLRSFLVRERVTATLVPLSPGRASLVARLEAPFRRYAEPLVLLSHLDTHPATPPTWPVDRGPLSGAIASDSIWGRGVLDGKGLAALHAMTLAVLSRSGASLDRDVIMVSVAGGLSKDGRGLQSVIEAHPEVARAFMVLTKGGASWVQYFGDGRIVHTVATSEKGFVRLRLTATNRSPDGILSVSAVERLRRALSRVQEAWPRVRLTEPTRETLRYAAKDQPFFRQWMFRQPFLMQMFLVSDLAEVDLTRSLVADTLEVIRVSGGIKGSSVPPQRAIAILEGRLLPGTTPAGLRNRLRVEIGDPDVHVDIQTDGPYRRTPVDPGVLEVVARHARIEGVEDQTVVPIMSDAPSDARWFRELDRPVYGFVPFVRRPDSLHLVRGRGEHLPLDDIRRGLRVMTHLVVDLAGVTGASDATTPR